MNHLQAIKLCFSWLMLPGHRASPEQYGILSGAWLTAAHTFSLPCSRATWQLCKTHWPRHELIWQFCGEAIQKNKEKKKSPLGMGLRIWSIVAFGPVTISRQQGPPVWGQAGTWLYASFLPLPCTVQPFRWALHSEVAGTGAETPGAFIICRIKRMSRATLLLRDTGTRCLQHLRTSEAAQCYSLT